MKKAVYYNEITGDLLHTVLLSDDNSDYAEDMEEGVAVILTDNVDINTDHYYIRLDLYPPILTYRNSFPIQYNTADRELPADGAAELIITSIPLGSLLHVDIPDADLQIEEVNDGQVEISSDVAGEYKISLYHRTFIPLKNLIVRFV